MQTENYNELRRREIRLRGAVAATADLAAARDKDQHVAEEDPNELPEIGNKLLTLERALESMKEHLLVLSQRLAPVLDRTQTANTVDCGGRVVAMPKSELGERLEHIVDMMLSIDAGVSQTIERLAL